MLSEKALITTTPAAMRPIPKIAGASSDCLNKIHDITQISTMPHADHSA